MGKFERGIAEGRLAGSGCCGCGRPMGSKEVKILLPRYVQERDLYAGGSAAGRRFMCLGCYNRTLTSARTGRASVSRRAPMQIPC